MSRKHWMLANVADWTVPERFRSRPWGKLRAHRFETHILTAMVLTMDGPVHAFSTCQYFTDSAQRIVLPCFAPHRDPGYVLVHAHPFFVDPLVEGMAMNVQQSGQEYVRQMRAALGSASRTYFSPGVGQRAYEQIRKVGI